jgi:anti-sigma B factor antagonist
LALNGELVSEGEHLDITVDEGEERDLVRLNGRLGIDSSPSLRDRLLAILQKEPPKTVVVDLTEVSFIDAAGIATLLEALKIARNRRATLCLQGLQGRMVRLFEVTGLRAVFDAACKAGPAQLR